MKKILFSITLILLSILLAKADTWEEMSFDQAKDAQKLINKNPYIYDYCDCCDSKVLLFKVLSTEIMRSPYDKDLFTLKLITKTLARFEVKDNHIDISQLDEIFEDEIMDVYQGEYTLCLNYMWMLDAKSKKVKVVGSLINYEHSNHCEGAAEFVNPTKKETEIEDKEYIKWYKNNF